ncbi:SIMPL domain-containing protein [Saccharobesus litoralis]|nr:SIMPL domain-containing protein [Saccharobesus litoralis]
MKPHIAIVLFSTLFVFALNAHELTVPHVSVTGTATTYEEPDLIHWSISVKNEGPSLPNVSQTHSQVVANTLRLLKSQRLKKKSLQTTNMRFDEKYEYRERERKKVGYIAQTRIQFTLKNIDAYQQIWTELAKIDGVSVEQVTYDIENRIALRDKTRVLAIKAAKRKASALAKALDSDIAKPILIEDISYDPRPAKASSANAVRMLESHGGGGDSAIALGQIQVTMQVNVKFQLVD